ncbi:hypothetical protein ACFQHW_03525 [Lapidilactobacillus achengensis]|uniref:Uncharacterized protein n=1 Tax=Lapidilactobacillus achengensis TaxID=2486000 RepID=A0ABW1UP72_9LACO|nr:hypothetical protein [Lapidilactobacillus achengensis]
MFPERSTRWKPTDPADSSRTSLVHQTDYSGVTNLKLVTTNHGRRLRGSSSIDHSLPVGVSASMNKVTLSGAWRWWSVYSSGGRSGWG